MKKKKKKKNEKTSKHVCIFPQTCYGKRCIPKPTKISFAVGLKKDIDFVGLSSSGEVFESLKPLKAKARSLLEESGTSGRSQPEDLRLHTSSYE